MSIVPSDFLSSAKEMMRDNSEPVTRNVVSRAYYSAFHQSQSVFDPDVEFAKSSRVGIHQTYIDQLMRADTGSLERIIAVKLGSMKGKRVKADYRLNEDLPSYVAGMQVKAAEEIFSLLAQVDRHPTEDAGATSQLLSTAASSGLPNRPKLTRIR